MNPLLLTFIKGKHFPYLLLVIALVVIFFQFSKNKEYRREERIAKQNVAALKDTLRIVRTKNGEMQASISAYIATEKELRDLNEDLYNNLENEKGKVVTLNRTVLKLKQDTSILRRYISELESEAVEPIEINDSTFQIPWKLTYRYDSTNYDIFEGRSQIKIGVGTPFKVNHDWTELRSRETSIDLTFGQKVENNQLRVFVNSAYPGLSPASLEGVLIDPNSNPYIKRLIKKRHWFTGFGVGPNISLGWNFIDDKPGLVVGGSIHYNIYQW